MQQILHLGRDSALRCSDVEARRPITWMYFSGYGVGVCSPPAAPLAEGVALGCSLPDSIMVGRTGPIPSGFVLRGLGGRDALFCSTCTSLFTGVTVAETAGLVAAGVSESDAPVPVDCGTDRLFRPSPASAPAARICSSVGAPAADFFSRSLGFVRAGAADSEGACSEDGAVCLGASGFVSRGTTTSCACICQTRKTLQSNGLKNPFSIKRLVNKSDPLANPGSQDLAEFSQLDA